MVASRGGDGSAAWNVRRYAADDEAAAIELWRRTWQEAYPQLDFSARLDWWRARWRDELVPVATVTIAERAGALIGFVTVAEKTGYLDQNVVAREAWGTGLAAALVAEAKRLSPSGLDVLVNQDNARAVRFYEKQGFSIVGADVNPRSGAALHKMRWRP